MQNDCEVYVDPEEDEVFFGCVSEKEKTVCAKLVKHEASNPEDDLRFYNAADNCTGLNENEAMCGNKLIHEKINELLNKSSTDITNSFDSVKSQEKFNKSFLKDDALSKITSNNTVEIEHNYSTPMKNKIDKSILTTPKSIVKADKDGGFLKVLSEIALVKAEAEGDKKSERGKEDEDKENTPSVPEIRVMEATPEKGSILSPPRSITSELRRFRIIHNSPQSESNVAFNSKSFTAESERNFKKKWLNEDVEKFLVNGKRQSIDLIDLKDITEPELKESFPREEGGTHVLTQETSARDDKDKSSEIPRADVKNVVSAIASSPKSPECPEQEADKTPCAAPNGLRFSKDARKIVEVLKKWSVEDALNFTIPELNVQEGENSFLSLESVSMFDETVVPREVEIQFPKSSSPKGMGEPHGDKMKMKSKTVEKDQRKLTPRASQNKPIKYFSETKNGCAKRLHFEEKKAPGLDKMRDVVVDSKAAPFSRIPVLGAKNSKIPLAERTPRPLAAKAAPAKSPLIKSYKNSKFNHIESPINAYIHNKPTSLVLNIKAEVKKESVTKVWKAQTAGDLKKVEEKRQKTQNSGTVAGVRLPFVEYKSTTPFKIEKRPESRLPRLAPTVMKLIGSHSPKVLRHEGRFYVNSPRSQCPAENGTLVADPNEVSVLVSQPAEKSNTIK